MAQKRVIDRRNKEKFMLDDEYLNGQARLCGWQATIVYNSLCRHANINQECFPSIKMMMEQHNVSRNTILKGIESLERRKVIEVRKTRGKSGRWLNNTYILCDKSEWDYSHQVPHKDMDTTVTKSLTSECQVPHRDTDQVPHRDTKETHKQGNTYKETHLICENEFSRDIPKVIELFKELTPSLSYGNKTQRKACQELLSRFGLEETLRMVGMVISAQEQDKFCPRATTPHAMWTKIGDLKMYFNGKRNHESKLVVL